LETRTGFTDRAPALAAAAGLLALIAWRYGPILAALDTSFADFDALHADHLLTEAADSRLNAWILDWVQHSALSAPLGVLDTNAFYPALGTLTGSEHLFGVALQTLPFRPWLGAIGLHQLALVLSTLGLAATSFLAVRAWTGSVAGGFAAAAAAVMMPWRLTEISHLQLSSAHWFPLIWWGLVRAVYREPGRAERLALAVVVAVQLLSSFYLAYFLTFSCALLLASIGFGDAERRGRLPAIAACLAPGYLLFGLSALPYLARRHGGDLAPGYDPALSIGLERLWALLHPRLPGWLAGREAVPLAPDAVYDLPAGVVVLALVSGFVAFERLQRSREAGGARELRGAVVALWSIALLGAVFALGGSLEIFGLRLPLPTRLFAAVLPGFDMLRGSVRWAILASLALPLLAGIGLATVERHAHGAARRAIQALAGLVLAASLDWFAIPARAAWDDASATQRRYAALRALPPGPVVEVPFTRPLRDEELGSRALLASTLHRRPLVNGYTGYAPPSHALLRRIGARLPEREAIELFGRLAGARWFVVDHAADRPRDTARWQQHRASGLVELRFGDATHRIYELRSSAAAEAGSGIASLRAPTPGPTTLAGLPRTALSLAADAGRLSVRTPPQHSAGIHNPLQVRISNDSTATWPGLDVHREGLVLLRVTWRAAGDDTPLETRSLAFDRDLAPGESAAARLELAAPLRDGPHDLCLDLVQQLHGLWVPLGIPPVSQRVTIVRPAGLRDLHELIDAYQLPPIDRAPCTAAGPALDRTSPDA
jgi:hypothetical protein